MHILYSCNYSLVSSGAIIITVNKFQNFLNLI